MADRRENLAELSWSGHLAAVGLGAVGVACVFAKFRGYIPLEFGDEAMFVSTAAVATALGCEALAWRADLTLAKLNAGEQE